MLSQSYHNQENYEAFTSQKNMPLQFRKAPVSSKWNEYIPVKYNFLEYDKHQKYIPGFECQFKEVKPYYRQEITYMPIPRSQISDTHRQQIMSNQIQYDLQSDRRDIEMPPNTDTEWNFGKKVVEYNDEIDQKRRETLQSEIKRVEQIQNQDYLNAQAQMMANNPKKQTFKLTSQQYEECERYIKGEDKQSQYESSYQQQQQSQSNMQKQQSRQFDSSQSKHTRQRNTQQKQVQFYETSPSFRREQASFHQSQSQRQFRNQQQQQQPQGMVLNPLKYQQENYQQQQQFVPQSSMNLHPLQERNDQSLNASGFTFNQQPQQQSYQIQQQQQQQIQPIPLESMNLQPRPIETGVRFFPRETTLDQYLFESDLAKRRIEDTRMMNRAISEEHLFYSSQGSRFRIPFHEAQGLESNHFYAKPNLYKHSIQY